MKLRLRSLEFNRTLKIKVPNSCSLQQLIDTLSQIISSPSSSSSLHLSFNRKDEIRASSPHDSLHSLGVAAGDLIFYSFNPTAFSRETLPHKPESASCHRRPSFQNAPETLAGDAPSTLAVEKHPTLGSVKVETVEMVDRSDDSGSRLQDRLIDLPPCFMELPMELKGLILERVAGVDLAKLACTCSELRFLCSGNELWKKKYFEEFGKKDLEDFEKMCKKCKEWVFKDLFALSCKAKKKYVPSRRYFLYYFIQRSRSAK